MSAQGALFAVPAPAVDPPRRFRFLGHLDAEAPSFPRLAAQRIGALDARGDIEAALTEVPRDFHVFVETLVVDALAKRVAAAPHEAIRVRLLEQVPETLLARVEPKARSWAITKPWLKRGET